MLVVLYNNVTYIFFDHNSCKTANWLSADKITSKTRKCQTKRKKNNVNAYVLLLN